MDFNKALLKYEKDLLVKFTREKLEAGYGVVNFYNDYIFEAIKVIGNEVDVEKYNIVEEHLCSEIIRTVIEVCFEYVVREKQASNGKKVVVCSLANELHTLPPRISVDYFTLAGFETYFLGVNTPDADIIKALESLEADYVAISVTNYLLLTSLKNTVAKIREASDCKIVVGGLAVNNNLEFCKSLGVDYIIESFSDVGGI